MLDFTSTTDEIIRTLKSNEITMDDEIEELIQVLIRGGDSGPVFITQLLIRVWADGRRQGKNDLKKRIGSM